MAKPIKSQFKIQIPAGKANPAPPVGPILGQHGVNIGEFCTKFNEATKDMGANIIPAIITVYEDRSYDFQLKTPPTSDLIRKALGIEKGSGKPNRQKVGKITKAQVKEIAEKKLEDMNAHDIEGAMKMVEGTAKNMGIEVEG